MRSLKLLIKIEQQKLDYLRIELGNTEEALKQTATKRDKLDQQMQEEQRLYTISEFAISLENYIKSSNKKLAKYDQQIKNYKQRIEELREQINLAFSTIKKYELLLKQKLQENIALENKYEQNDLDELSITRHNSSGNS